MSRSDTVAQPRDSQPSFLKTLANLDVLALGFGAMIGFGWVVLTGDWLTGAGTAGAILAFLVGGAIMCLVGLVYSELVAAMPHAGGEHNYLMRGMGPHWALLGSWGITGGYITVVAFEAVALPRTALYLFPELNRVPLWTIAGSQVHLTWALTGSIAAAIITWINIRGIKIASLVQTFVVTFLIAVAAVMLVGAFAGGQTSNTEPLFAGGAAGLIGVLVMVPFLFVGFDVIPQSAEEARIPPRQIGKLVVVSVLMAIAFYVIIVATTSLAMPADQLAASDLATADGLIALLGHSAWGKIIVAGGLAGIITSWIAFLIGSSRLLWAMANSGMIPQWFGKLHPRYRTPVNALLFIGGLSVAAPFFGESMLSWAVDSGSPSIVIAYFLVSVTFLLLRRSEPLMVRPMRVGGAGNRGQIIGILSALFTLALAALYLPGMPAGLDAEPWIIFGAWWVLGAVFLLRLPRGIGTGPEAETRLLRALADRRSGGGVSGH